MSRAIVTKSTLLFRAIGGGCGSCGSKATLVTKSSTILKQIQPLFINLMPRALLSDSASLRAQLEKALSGVTEAVKKDVDGVFLFEVAGNKFLVNATASASGPVKLSDYKDGDKIDATLILDGPTFAKIAAGEMKPAAAFMGGKMKITGNMAKALKSQKLFTYK